MKYLKVNVFFFALLSALLYHACSADLVSPTTKSVDNYSKKLPNQTQFEDSKFENSTLADTLEKRRTNKDRVISKFDFKTKTNDKYRLLAWNAKRNKTNLPIRPLKLKVTNKTASFKNQKISYGSFVKVRSLKDSEVFNSSKPFRNLTFSNDSISLKTSEALNKSTDVTMSAKENDILEISSSEHQTWAHKKSPNQSYIKVYLKPWSKNQKIQNSSFIFEGFKPKHIPKLLLPKFSRPAMYSLNGYIPKPNMQSFTTTTTTKKPTIVKYKKFGIETRTVKKTENQEKILIQKKYGSKKLQNDEETNDLNASGTINRKKYSFSKKKSSLNSIQSLNGKNRSRSRTGTAGKDFPTFTSIPKTSFDCKDQSQSGIFADKETDCQVWHMCQGLRKHSFLCPNRTIFNQKAGICDWWYNVDCEND